MIDTSIADAELILGRKLTGEELLILGIAYQKGFLQGIKYVKEGGSLEGAKGTGTKTPNEKRSF